MIDAKKFAFAPAPTLPIFVQDNRRFCVAEQQFNMLTQAAPKPGSKLYAALHALHRLSSSGKEVSVISWMRELNWHRQDAFDNQILRPLENANLIATCKYSCVVVDAGFRCLGLPVPEFVGGDHA